jgi:hypothetical protein
MRPDAPAARSAASLGITTSRQYFWGSGLLSSVLDNAPTYLSFLSACSGRFVDPDIVSQVGHLVQTHGADLTSLTGPYADEIRQTFLTLQRYHPGLVDGLVLVCPGFCPKVRTSLSASVRVEHHHSPINGSRVSSP